MEQNGTGFVKVSEEVINKIAYTATLETEGVTAVTVKKVNAKELIKTKKMPKGISYQTTEEGLVFDVSVTVTYGTKIQEVAAAIQSNVIDNVQTMTGLDVCRVNVSVIGVEAVK